MRLRSLKLKIILSSAACILAVGIFSNACLYRYLSGIIAEKADSVDQAGLESVQARMNRDLMRFYSLGYTCANDLDIARALRYGALRTLPQKTDGIKAQEKLWGLLESSAAKDYVTKLVAFNDSGVMVQPGNTRRQSSPGDVARIQALPVFAELREGGDLWLPRPSKSIAGGEDCLVYLSPVYDATSMSNRGWLYLEISSGWIADEQALHPPGSFIVLDGAGALFPGKRQALAHELPPPGQVAEVRSGESTYKIRSAPLGQAGLTLYHRSDITFLSRDGQPILFTAVVVVATSLAVAVLLSVLLSSLITRPLARLMARIEKITANDLSFDPEIEQGGDEIAQTGRLVNQMVGSVRHLLRETEEMHLQNKNSEIALLQSQVNPHFLYNTLDSIHWMATIQKNTGIMTMTRSLSSLLKNLAKGIGDKVTLGEELSLVGDYVKIQQIRYMETFQLRDCIAPSLYKYNIVKFTLQPLVENAIFHGIEPKGELGAITLSAAEDGGDLLISVEDDGVGMSPQELAALKNSARNAHRSGLSGIGVANVDSRLRLVYGERYGISIESELGRFTRATVRIPKEV